MEARSYTPEDYRDFAHVGPGTLAGRWLRHFWQPVMKSSALEVGRPKRLQILSDHFTAYRGEDGKAYVVQDACPHRMTRLSLGWVEGDAIRCFYHGWKFDGSGRCVHQPAEPCAHENLVYVAVRMTRWIAPTIRSNSARSASSCFRPDAVTV